MLCVVCCVLCAVCCVGYFKVMSPSLEAGGVHLADTDVFFTGPS